MSANNSGAQRTTATPFVVALVIAALVIGGIVVWNVIRPSGERVPDSGQISRTVGQYYGALNRGRYADLVVNTCAKDRALPTFPQEAGFAEARRKVVEREGEAKFEQQDIRDISVVGDTATADLTIRYYKAPERTEAAKFVREDGKWKKCS